jgi:hypothetical protein
VTREQILAVADSVRGHGGILQDPTTDIVDTIIRATCDIDASLGEELQGSNVVPFQSATGVDGFIALTAIYSFANGFRYCDFGAIALTDVHATLTGTSTLRHEEGRGQGIEA